MMPNKRDFLIQIERGTGRGLLVFNNPDTPIETWMNNVYLSLMIERGSDWLNPFFGSNLHLLSRSKNTQQTELLAKNYCEEALNWLLDYGRANEIIVETERINPPIVHDDLFILKISVIIFQQDGYELTFEVYKEVL